MPSHHRAQSEWNLERFLNWASGIGSQTEQFVRGLLESRQHPELSYRSCLGLQQTVQHLRELKLTGMADAFAQQLEQPVTQQLSFEERLALLVDRERTQRDNRRLQRLLNAARLKQQACVEDINYLASRGLMRSQVASLINCEWIGARQNLHITGATGTGKSWLACAFGQAACRQGLSVRYERTGRLLDDFGLKPLQQQERHDLLEIIEDRHELYFTILTSQLPISAWHSYLGEPTVADALLDRLLTNAHRLELKGESLRKTRKKSPAVDDGEAAK